MLRRSVKMASKDISSYFSKPAAAASSSTASGSSKSPVNGNGTKRPPPSGTSATDASPAKKSGLPTAMQQAILDGAREAKRPKVEGDSEAPTPLLPDRGEHSLTEGMTEPAPPPAAIFGSVSSSSPTRLKLPTATTKAELLESLESHPHKKDLLQLELDTLGEDWLLALQDELTKPYFLTLKEFVTKEQQTKKVFPPGTSWSMVE